MKRIGTSLAAAALAAVVSTAAMAQPYPEIDMNCRHYAMAQVAPLQNQNAGQQVGSTLLGAGLGAALGAAVGGGRGAAIGAASGAVVGTGVGAANAQNNNAYIQQQYGAYYWQCMSAQGYGPR
ncbi:MAG: YMGG-like glycine zipper-containing protein [Stellaceae bacterium]